MATTGLEVFDRTLHTTNLWLDEINAEIGPDRHLAWHVLGAVLRSIRDEMQVEQSAHFAAQLPLLVRGAYFDQYRPAAQPAAARSPEDFIGRIQHDLGGARPVKAQAAIDAVMRTLNRHVTEGQIKKVRDALPKGVRAMWPEPGHKAPEHNAPEHKAHEHKTPEHSGGVQQRPAQSPKPGQGAESAEAARPSAGQTAAGGHAAPPAPRSEPPRPAPPQHSASQHAAPHRPAQHERQDIREDIDEMEASRRSAHVPMDAAGRPVRVHAAPAAAGTPKTKTRAKRTDG